jgi:GntR family transcriptional regulator of arabinose operon
MCEQVADEKPKYRVINRWIEEKIESGELPDGAKVPSENELAEQFHFSRQTVRQAISTLESNGLVVRVRGSGTFVKRAPAKFKPKTMNIGVIITCLDDYVFPSIVQGIEGVLTHNNYTMSFGITYNKVENEANALKQMLRMGVDGLIAEGTKSALPNPNIEIYKKLQAEKIPCVFINGYYDDIGNGYVVIDDVAAGEMVCNELIKNNHIRIAGVFKSDDMQGHKRYQGFVNAMYRHDIRVHDEAVIWYTTEDFVYLFKGDFDQIILNRIQGCTAVVCYNDLVAVEIISLLKRNGIRVPEDISVISFDNSSIAAKELYNLTSIIYPSYEIGKKSAECIIEMIHDPAKKTKYKFATKLKIRKSVKLLK